MFFFVLNHSQKVTGGGLEYSIDRKNQEKGLMTLLEGLLWLTLNVYHEARSEPEIGQMAVALVTLNRANERHLPIKEIVQEPYQFSWTFQKDSYLPDDPKAFLKCLKSVYIALQTKDFTQALPIIIWTA